MAGGLDLIEQRSFAAGIVRASAWNKIPGNGLYDATNMLLDKDGLLYRRGGVARWGTAAPAAFSDVFAVPTRGGTTYLVSSGTTGYFWNGFTPTSLGGQVAPGSMGGFSYLGGYSMQAGGGPINIWGGAVTGPLSYATGTCTVTAGSATVVGIGTSWVAAGIVPGMLFSFGGMRPYIVKQVVDATHLVLDRPYEWITDTFTYTLKRLEQHYPGNMADAVSCLAVVGERTVVGAGRRIWYSLGPDPNSAEGIARPLHIHGDSFLSVTDDGGGLNNFHEFPDRVIALAALRDRLFVFTAAGCYVVSNLALDNVDQYGNAQHRVELFSKSLIPAGYGSPQSVLVWNDSMIVAARDGVYLVDGVGSSTLLSASIARMWEELLVGGGFSVAGIAVYRNHLLIGTSSQTLVCRLDSPLKTPLGTVYPWMRLTSGAPGALSGAVAVTALSTTTNPKLFGANGFGGAPGSTFAHDFSTLFDETVDADGDGTRPTCTITTRQFEPGGDTMRGYVKDLKLDYFLSAATGTPTVDVSTLRADDATIGQYGPAFPGWSVGSGAPINTGAATDPAKPYVLAMGLDARRIAFSFRCAAPSKFRFRGLSMRVRGRGRTH